MNASKTIFKPDFSHQTRQTIGLDKKLPAAFPGMVIQATSGKEMKETDYSIPEEDRFFCRSFYGFWRIK